MARIERTVFISYRRKDISWALAVYQHLTSQKYDVFFDFSSLSSGDIEQVIVSNIKARAHFVLILTPTALDRCSEPGDWLRREIEIAIDEKRNIIPLFFDGFSFGTPSVAERLTGKLSAINRYNGLDIPSGYFMEAMQRLRGRYLNVPLNSVIQPVSTEVRKVVKDEQIAADKALIQKSEDIKELVKPAEEKPGKPKVEQTTKPIISSLRLGRRDSGDDTKPNLRLYGIGAGILLLVVLGFFSIRSLISSANANGNETPMVVNTATEASVVMEPATEVIINTATSVPTIAVEPVTSTSAPIPPTQAIPSKFLKINFVQNTAMDVFDIAEYGPGENKVIDRTLTDEGLALTLGGKELYLYYFYKPFVYQDVVIKLRAENIGSINRNNVSLICRKNNNTWYELSVANDGLWFLYNYDERNAKRYTLLGNGGSNAIKTGKNVNEYEMRCNGNEISLFINGRNVRTVKSDLYAEGQVGFNISSLDLFPIEINVSEFEVSKP